ncbi:MAG: hypothetical protein Q4G08_10095 [Capnocytophaga sp.]|nr:hypothetical protein [Capnocytophaga sp.]
MKMAISFGICLSISYLLSAQTACPQEYTEISNDIYNPQFLNTRLEAAANDYRVYSFLGLFDKSLDVLSRKLDHYGIDNVTVNAIIADIRRLPQVPGNEWQRPNEIKDNVLKIGYKMDVSSSKINSSRNMFVLNGIIEKYLDEEKAQTVIADLNYDSINGTDVLDFLRDNFQTYQEKGIIRKKCKHFLSFLKKYLSEYELEKLRYEK